VPELVLLGVGSDGHTASLFPGSPALDEPVRLAVAADAGLEPFVPRVTLTLAAIATATHVVFLVTGEPKAEQVRRAFADPPSPAVPASLARSAAGRTTVILDGAAASRL
jgi:6-phosphogluconolactonase